MAADLRLHGVPPVGAAQSGGYAADGAADLPAHAVAVFAGLCRPPPQHFFLQNHGIYGDIQRFQERFRQTARHGQRCGEPPGEPPAAPVVVAPAGTDEGGVVGVAGAGGVPQRRVVAGADIPVAQHRHQRVAGGAALIDPGEELYLVRLVPSGGQSPGGLAPQQVCVDQLAVHRQTGWNILDENPHGGAVGLSEDRVFHHGSSTSILPPRASISFQKSG